MTGLARDLWLVGQAEAAIDTTTGLAHSTNAVIGAAHKSHALNAARVRVVAEIVARHTSLVLTVAPSVATYSPDMDEGALRRWAAGLVACLS